MASSRIHQPSNIQDRPPNFRGDDGRLYLVRCFNCGDTENWAIAVASGVCAWCGWKEDEKKGTESA